MVVAISMSPSVVSMWLHVTWPGWNPAIVPWQLEEAPVVDHCRPTALLPAAVCTACATATSVWPSVLYKNLDQLKNRPLRDEADTLVCVFCNISVMCYLAHYKDRPVMQMTHQLVHVLDTLCLSNCFIWKYRTKTDKGKSIWYVLYFTLITMLLCMQTRRLSGLL